MDDDRLTEDKNPAATNEAIPESLAQLLMLIRTDILSASKEAMAELLNAARRVPNEKKNYNRNTISKLESRIGTLTFEHLESYARAIGVPMPVLNFVSRYQRGNLDEAEHVLNCLLSTVRRARKEGKSHLNSSDLAYLSQEINLNTRGKVSHDNDLPLINHSRRRKNTKE